MCLGALTASRLSPLDEQLCEGIVDVVMFSGSMGRRFIGPAASFVAANAYILSDFCFSLASWHSLVGKLRSCCACWFNDLLTCDQQVTWVNDLF